MYFAKCLPFCWGLISLTHLSPDQKDDSISKFNVKSIFTWGLFWPSGIIVACVCLSFSPCVHVCVNLQADNPIHIQARTTKFGQKMQNTFH